MVMLIFFREGLIPILAGDASKAHLLLTCLRAARTGRFDKSLNWLLSHF